MKHLVDGLVVLLVALIVWGVTAILVAMLTRAVLPPETALPLAALIATVIAGGLVFFWAAGRRASVRKDQQRSEDRHIAADFGGCIESKDTVSFIYDVEELPHPKEVILRALLRLAANDVDQTYRQMCAAVAPLLAQFQPGVGESPIMTSAGVITKTAPTDESKESTERSAKLIASHEKTELERQAEREWKEIEARVMRALS